MTVIETSVPAATAVVGYDLLSSRPESQVSGGHRVLRLGALAGSAAAGDARIGLMVGGQRIATLFNTATGFPQTDRDGRDLGDAYVPPGERVSALVEDAPATNPLNILLVIEEIAGPG